MRTALLVLTPLECRKTIMSRMTFCSSHDPLIRFRRFGPMPSTSSRRADALDHAAAKVFLDAFLGRWWRAGEHLGSELLPVFPVLNPTALGREPFPGADG